MLIDGNSLIFQSYLLKQGSKGGQQAADIFKEKLMAWAASSWPDVTMHGAVVRVFANVKVLAEKCRKANLVPSTEIFGKCQTTLTVSSQDLDETWGNVRTCLTCNNADGFCRVVC